MFYSIINLILVLSILSKVNGHGFLAQPVARNAAFLYGFPTPTNYDYMSNFCGGYQSQWGDGKARCGVCGDAYNGKRHHEINGAFVTKPPIIVKNYRRGEVIDVSVKLTANHGGFFVFQLCPATNDHTEVLEGCFYQNTLKIVKNNQNILAPDNSAHEFNSVENNKVNYNKLNYNLDDENYTDHGNLEVNNISDESNKFNPVNLLDTSLDQFKFKFNQEGPKTYNLKVKLPDNMTCRRCVFRWIYVTGNSWGICKGHFGRLGCGVQEEFRNCADISIQ